MKKFSLLVISVVIFALSANAQGRDVIILNNAGQISTESYYQNTSKRFPNVKTKGYYGLVELGYLRGVGDIKTDIMSLSVVNGYQFNPYIAIGLGLGIDFDYYYIPVFLHMKTNFITGDLVPFFSFNFGFTHITSGQLMFNPNIGITHRISQACALNLSLGYNASTVDATYMYDHGYISRRVYHALTFNIGFSF